MMNENQLTIVNKNEIIKPLVHKIDSIIEYCYRDCHIKYFYTFKNRCVYYFKFTSLVITKYLIKKFLIKTCVYRN